MKPENTSANGIIPMLFEHYKAEPQLYTLDNIKEEILSDKVKRQFIMGAQTMFVKWTFKKGAQIPLHFHANEQITWITAGSVEVKSQGKIFIVNAGQFIVFPAFVPHEFMALEDTIDLDFFAPVRADWLTNAADYFKKYHQIKEFLMNACEYLLTIFEKEGVNYIFMVPGMHIDPIMSELKNHANIKGIVACHEGGAAFMADGYAKASGKFGIAAGIAGPGITNMITGITCAHSDHTPIFIITGETVTSWEGRGAFQDGSSGGININSLLASITMKRMQVNHAELLQNHVDMLMRTMLSGTTRGPVQLSLSLDVQRTAVKAAIREQSYLSQPRYVDRIACEKVWDYFNGTKKIAILAGSGALHSNAEKELLQFAEQYHIPVATTHAAKGIFPEDHALALGVLGWYGNPYAMETLLKNGVEVLIVIGARFSQISTAKWSDKLIPTKALIINDINESQYFGNYIADHFILGDAAEFLQTLTLANNKSFLLDGIAERKKWLHTIHSKGINFYDSENLTSKASPIHPARVIYVLQHVMPANTLLFTGEGASSFFAAHYWVCRYPRQYFTQVKFISAMGWSIAAAIGGKLARPDLPVVAIIGDGSMLMHGMEIQTAARNNIAVIFVVFNNGAHGNPQLRARKVGKFEAEFLDLPIHDWTKVAEGLGVTAFKVTKHDELESTFKKAHALNKPVLIDIRTGNYPTPVKITPFPIE